MSATPRVHAIDSAKGIGIILVVFGHAWRGASNAGLIPDADVFARVDMVIYAFHMPLFFFLSGLIFLDAARKYNLLEMARSRILRLLWPMVLWGWLFFGFRLAAGQAANTPVTLGDFPLIPLPPYEHLWFLWALFLCQGIFILLFAAVPRRIPDLAWGLIAGAGGLVLALYSAQISVPSLIWGPMVAHLPYFLIGIAVGSCPIRPLGPVIAALAAAVFIGNLYLVMIDVPSSVPTLTSLLIVIFGWMAWCGIDRGADAPALRLLRYLGQVSMVIYLTHTIFSATVRIALLRLGADDVFVVLVATTTVGLAAPLAVLWLARRWGLVRVLGF